MAGKRQIPGCGHTLNTSLLLLVIQLTWQQKQRYRNTVYAWLLMKAATLQNIPGEKNANSHGKQKQSWQKKHRSQVVWVVRLLGGRRASTFGFGTRADGGCSCEAAAIDGWMHSPFKLRTSTQWLRQGDPDLPRLFLTCVTGCRCAIKPHRH